jgi:signal peptidase I
VEFSPAQGPLSTPPSQGGQPPSDDNWMPRTDVQETLPQSQIQQAPSPRPKPESQARQAPPTKAEKAARRRRLVIEYVIIIAVAVGLALLVQAYVVKPYRIPSGSMENTLMVGDRVFVNRFIYHFRSVHRGDIVVFREPGSGPDAGTVLIKRVIGLPGDVISLQGGSVYVNGKRLSEPYVRQQRNPDGTFSPEPTIHFDGGMPFALAGPYRVPAGDYFMMGDNRTDSGDSRQFGPMPRSDIIGEAFLIYWPLNRLRIL